MNGQDLTRKLNRRKFITELTEGRGDMECSFENVIGILHFVMFIVLL